MTARATKAKPSKSDETRARILEHALALFRKQGVEATTMRQISAAAGVALGAAYYYFPSKDAIILAYYQDRQSEHAARARARFVESDDPRVRVAAVLTTRLDTLAKDRKLLVAIFRGAADPDSETSFFGAATENVRRESIALYDEALADAVPDARTRELLALSLWSLQMGILLYFLHDRSPGAKKTRALADGAVAQLSALLPLMPIVAPALEPMRALLDDAGLLEK